MASAPFDLSLLRVLVPIGVLMLLLAWESAAPFFDFFRGRGSERLKHGLRNIVLSVANILMVALGFSVAWALVAGWAEENGFGLLHRLNLGTWTHFLLALLLLDFWTYWWHWLNHQVPFFWRFHRMHHSDPRMDVTTANRFHLGEIILSSLIRIGLIPLLGLRLWELMAYEVLLFAVVQFHHANIGLPDWLDRLLRCLIPTPAMHKVHHSRLPVETNSNYSSLLSVWDRVFKTFRLRKDLHGIEFGLNEFRAPEDQTLAGLLKTPLARKISRQG